MKYTILGKSNMSISKLTLGTWAIGGACWGSYDEKRALSAIETAIDNGITCIDTSPIYGNGQAEILVGKAIKRTPREKIIIATKCGLDMYKGYSHNLSAANIKKEIDESLKRLDIDYVDLYQCHWPDPNTPLEETMETLKELQVKGKIRYIGVSNFTSADIEKAMQYAEIVSYQPHYSLLERSFEKEQQQTCLKHNIKVISYGSLGAGLLTGKYKERPKFGKGDCRTFFYKYFQQEYWPKVQEVIKSLEAIAHEFNTTPGCIALAWLMSQPCVASPIVGARNPKQVIDNLKSVEVELTTAHINNLNKLTEHFYE